MLSIREHSSTGYELPVITNVPDSKVQGANMGPTWVLLAPDGPRVGPTNLAIRVTIGTMMLYSLWIQPYGAYLFIPENSIQIKWGFLIQSLQMILEVHTYQEMWNVRYHQKAK